MAASASASEPVDEPAVDQPPQGGLPVLVGEQLDGLPRREVGHLDVAARRAAGPPRSAARAGPCPARTAATSGASEPSASGRRPGRSRRGRRSPRRASRPGAPAPWRAPRRAPARGSARRRARSRVSRSNAVGSSTTRSPVAVPSDPVGPSVVAATGAAPGRRRAAEQGVGLRAVAGASTSTRAGVPRPLRAQPGQGTVDDGGVLARAARSAPCRRRRACSPRRTRSAGIATHGRGGPGPDRSLRLDLPARAGAHQVVLQPGRPGRRGRGRRRGSGPPPVALASPLRGSSFTAVRAARRACAGSVRRVGGSDLEAGDPQRPGRGVGVELAAPRGRPSGRRPWRRTPARPPRRPRRRGPAARRRSRPRRPRRRASPRPPDARMPWPRRERMVRSPAIRTGRCTRSSPVTPPSASARAATPHPRRARRRLGVSGPGTGPS